MKRQPLKILQRLAIVHFAPRLGNWRGTCVPQVYHEGTGINYGNLPRDGLLMS